MRQSELEKLYIKNQHGTFMPVCTYEKAEPIKDEQSNIIDYELVGYVQSKTAEEAYQKYLVDKENPPAPQPTETERLASVEKAIAILMGV